MKDRLTKIAPYTYLILIASGIFSAADYLYTLISSDLSPGLRSDPLFRISNVVEIGSTLVITTIILIVFLGIRKRKKWAYWANVLFFIGLLLSLLMSILLYFIAGEMENIFVLAINILLGLAALLIILDKSRYLQQTRVEQK